MTEFSLPADADDRRGQYLLTRCLGSTAPALAYLPHCLIQPGRQAVATVLKATHTTGGIFGDQPEWDRDGRFYLGDIGKQPQDFSLWEQPKNQELVLEHGGYAKLDQFTAVIDSRTDPGV